MTVALYLVAILGLAVLMVVHETGHYLAARKFGMRVVRFSIGFGPTIWKHKPKESATVYQVALIPFLAYVQIAGMNPYEESDPKDPASYANASLSARIFSTAVIRTNRSVDGWTRMDPPRVCTWRVPPGWTVKVFSIVRSILA